MRIPALVIVASLTLNGCGVVIPYRHSEAKFDRLELGQTKTQVQALANRPSVVRGSKLLDDGKTVEIGEYRLYPRNTWWIGLILGIPLATIPWWIVKGEWSPYWVQYTDGKLTRWGAAGDWQADTTVNKTYNSMNK